VRFPRLALSAATATALALACTGAPPSIAYARADCDYCRMRIDDPRFGGEIITAHGKALQFDAVECLASYYNALPDRGTARSLLVADFEHPGTLIAVDRARFIRVAGGHTGSPMGRGLLAVSSGSDVAKLTAALGGGNELSWAEVLASTKPGAEAAAAPAGPAPASAGARQVIDVSPDGPVRTVGDALRAVARGGTIIVHPGTYREPTIVVSIPVTISGEGWPVLDGEHVRQIMTVTADSVTLRGLRFRNVGVAFTEDLAAIKVLRAGSCTMTGNEIEEAFFGIYLQEARNCLIERNVLRATNPRDATSGNGIHLWNSRDIAIVGNRITGHRDGIYFEFVRQAHVRGNVSEGNLRYGLHFMYSDSCDYASNDFRRNGAGVAVMYSHFVRMTGNTFADNGGAAAYGLLLKEIADARLERNVFSHNATGLFADGATRLTADHNDFLDNGWAVKLQASTLEASFTANNFAGNTFDLATNSRGSTATFTGNYWSAYEGYDLDHDGVGDVAFRPVRLSSVIVANNEPALILLRSSFMTLLDAAERVLPSLTPEGIADAAPSMHWVERAR
jgi:nitrous oxidase accessory protein